MCVDGVVLVLMVWYWVDGVGAGVERCGIGIDGVGAGVDYVGVLMV